MNNTSSHSNNEGVRHHARGAHVFKYAPRPSPRLPTHCLNAKWYNKKLKVKAYKDFIKDSHVNISYRRNDLNSKLLHAP